MVDMLLQNSKVPWTGRGTTPAQRCCVTTGLGVEALVGDHGGGAVACDAHDAVVAAESMVVDMLDVGVKWLGEARWWRCRVRRLGRRRGQRRGRRSSGHGARLGAATRRGSGGPRPATADRRGEALRTKRWMRGGAVPAAEWTGEGPPAARTMEPGVGGAVRRVECLRSELEAAVRGSGGERGRGRGDGCGERWRTRGGRRGRRRLRLFMLAG